MAPLRLPCAHYCHRRLSLALDDGLRDMQQLQCLLVTFGFFVDCSCSKSSAMKFPRLLFVQNPLALSSLGGWPIAVAADVSFH